MADDSKNHSEIVSRRRFIELAGVSGTAALAGCGGDGGNENGNGSGNGDSGDGSGNGDSSDYPSKEIRFIVPYSPGGGFDAYGRAAAQFVPKHLPNDVEIVVENVEGAGGRRGLKELARADPDGYTIGEYNIPSQVVSDLAGLTDVNVEKLSHITKFFTARFAVMVGADTGIKTWDDFTSADEVTLGATGEGGGIALQTTILKETVGLDNVRIVKGYDGTSGIRSAILNGEVDGQLAAWSNIKPLAEDGRVTPIMTIQSPPPEWAPNIPTAEDIGYSELQSSIGVHFMVGGPSDMPDEVHSTLEQAFLDAMDSEEFQSWADEQGRPLTPVSSEKAQKLVSGAYEAYKPYSDIFKE